MNSTCPPEEKPMKREDMQMTRDRAAGILERAGIVITPAEREGMEVADCGFGDIERVGLQVVLYANTDRYCAKEIILLPRQMFPEHRHPPLDNHNIGKQETFRCRWGKLFLYVPGEAVPDPQAMVPDMYRPHLKVWKEVVLEPGDQYTLAPDERHWFQAGDEGAVVSEFSSTSIDETDVFTDPRVKRIPVEE
jgi:D-lyxose ketol-isomerase